MKPILYALLLTLTALTFTGCRDTSHDLLKTHNIPAPPPETAPEYDASHSSSFSGVGSGG